MEFPDCLRGVARCTSSRRTGSCRKIVIRGIPELETDVGVVKTCCSSRSGPKHRPTSMGSRSCPRDRCTEAERMSEMPFQTEEGIERKYVTFRAPESSPLLTRSCWRIPNLLHATLGGKVGRGPITAPPST
eukprot:9489150-Pyramimonas_sp.AAC.1